MGDRTLGNKTERILDGGVYVIYLTFFYHVEKTKGIDEKEK